MKYELISVENGVERRKYPNGDIRDQNGRLLERPDRIKELEITQENASDYGRRRKERMMLAVENGLMKATETTDVQEAVTRLVAKRASVAMKDEGRAGNDAARLVLAALDAFPEKRVESVQTQRHVYEVDPETVKVIEEMMRQRRDGIVLEGEVV